MGVYLKSHLSGGEPQRQARDGGISARSVICAWSFLVSGSPQHRWGHRIPLICNQRFSNYGIPRNKSKVKLERLRSLLESVRRTRPIRVASLSVPQRFSADMRNRRKVASKSSDVLSRHSKSPRLLGFTGDFRQWEGLLRIGD